MAKLSIARENARLRAGLPVKDNMWMVGDALIGPSTVVEAMAQGKYPAISVLKHVRPKYLTNSNKGHKANILVTYDRKSGKTKTLATQILSEF